MKGYEISAPRGLEGISDTQSLEEKGIRLESPRMGVVKNLQKRAASAPVAAVFSER